MLFLTDSYGTLFCYLQDLGVTLTFSPYSKTWELSSEMFNVLENDESARELTFAEALKVSGGVSPEKALRDLMDILA